MPPEIDLRTVEAYLFDEARLLDEHRYEEWLALFSDDGSYWLPLEHDQANPEETVSLIYDDRRALETRVRQLSHPSRHAQTPQSWTNHLIGNVTIDKNEGNELRVRSSLQMVEARAGDQRLLAGECWHRLRREGDGFKIVQKRVNLVNCDAAHDGFTVPI